MGKFDTKNPKVQEGATPGLRNYNKFLSGDPVSPVAEIKTGNQAASPNTGEVGNPRTQVPKSMAMPKMMHDLPRMAIGSHQPSKASKVGKIRGETRLVG